MAERAAESVKAIVCEKHTTSVYFLYYSTAICIRYTVCITVLFYIYTVYCLYYCTAVGIL